jgi:sulfoacetaldehyde acetyltransferase
VQLNIPRDYFYGTCPDEIVPSLTLSRGPGPAADVLAAAKLLTAARFPVIIAGGGVSQANAVAPLTGLAERLGAPVVNSYLHNDTFPGDHRLAAGPIGYCGSKAAMRLLAKADVVLALGCRLGPFGTLAQYGLDYWPVDAAIIQVDANAKVLGLSRPVTLAVWADAAAFAQALVQAIGQVGFGPTVNADRLATIEKEKQAWAKELAAWSSSAQTPMHPRRFLQELCRAMPKGSIVATDIGNTSSMINAYLRFTDVRQHLAALSWGNCGFAFGAALGAKIGRPDKPVFCFQGDGAYGISGIAEVMTAVRENIPVIAVVANNFSWGAEKKNQIDYYANRFVGTDLSTNPDFARIADLMGARGYTVETPGQTAAAVADAVASNRPCVINAIIDGSAAVLAEPFRRDALKPPVRLLDKYRHLNAG